MRKKFVLSGEGEGTQVFTKSKDFLACETKYWINRGDVGISKFDD